MAGFDLYADAGTLQPFDKEICAGPRLMDIAENNGLLIRAVGDTIVLAPPLIITESQVAELTDRLQTSIGIWQSSLG